VRLPIGTSAPSMLPGLPSTACSPKPARWPRPMATRCHQQRALALAQIIEPGSFSSLHDDLVAGRRMELEALHG
jgi:hypothetical protein